MRSAELLSSFGLREKSVLNESKYFNTIRNATFDLMHDLLEGVCDMEIKLVLHHFIFVKKYFTAAFFNNRVASVMYGQAEKKNKPTANFSSHVLRNTQDRSLRQKAMQSWCLTRVFPFLVSDVIPLKEDSHFELIRLLLQILSIVFTPKISKEMIAYLEELIIDHTNLFHTLFPDVNIINKQHHLEHYASTILKMGPLTQYWCMRYEGKHNELKEWAHVCKNFKNIAKSLAHKHQISLAYHLDNIDNTICHAKGEVVNLKIKKILI